MGLDTSMEEIKMMSKEPFKEIVKASISKAAFIYLTDEKAKLSKIMNVSHNDVNLQPYFNPMSMDVDEAKFLFLLRSRMVEVKTNFKKSIVMNFVQCAKSQMTLNNIYLIVVNFSRT
jgi:hypothetical protein